jgi:thymidylate kinase
MTLSIKDMVKDNKKVVFTRYRHGNLYYKTEDGFEFPVPTSDIGDATFLAEDRAMLFMRYIRKALDEASTSTETPTE